MKELINNLIMNGIYFIKLALYGKSLLIKIKYAIS